MKPARSHPWRKIQSPEAYTRFQKDRAFQDWMGAVRRIVGKSLSYHHPNFEDWRKWFDAGDSAQTASDKFLRVVALLPE